MGNPLAPILRFLGLRGKSAGTRRFSSLMGWSWGWGGGGGGWSGDRLEQARHYRGWVYVAVKAIAEEVAGHPPRLAFRRPGGTSAKALKPWHRAKAITAAAPDDDLEPADPDHPLLRLLANPNPPDTGWTFWFKTSLNLEVHGAAYWWVIDGEDGLPAELWVIPAAWVWPRYQGQGGAADAGRTDSLIDHYEVRPYGCGAGSAAVTRLTPDEVVPFAYPGLSHPFEGHAPLDAGSLWVDVAESIDRARFARFKNSIATTTAVQLSPEFDDPTEEQKNRLRSILGGYQGEENTGKLAFLPPGCEIQEFGGGSGEMDYLGSAEQARDHILALFGVPKSIVGLTEDVNRASAAAARENFRSGKIRPKFLLIDGVITEKLASRYDGTLVVYHDELPAHDPETEQKKYDNALDRGAITRDEYRAWLGHDPYEQGGDVPLILGTLVPLSTVAPPDGAPPETPEAPDGQPEIQQTQARAELIQTVGGVSGLLSVLGQISAGALSPQGGAHLLRFVFGMSEEDAAALVHDVIVVPPPAPDGQPGVAEGNGALPEPPLATKAAGQWAEADHPRGDDGRFISGGDLSAAAGDPAKAQALRARVTNPTERAKLDRQLAGTGGPLHPEGHVKDHSAWVDHTERLDREHAAAVDAHAAEAARLENEHGANTASWEAKVKELESGHEERSSAWEKRDEARSARKDAIDQADPVDFADKAATAAVHAATGDGAQPGARADAYAAAWADHVAKVPDALRQLGAEDADIALIDKALARGGADVTRAAAKAKKAGERHAEHLAKEPPGPVEPDEPEEPEEPGDDATPAQRAAYEKQMAGMDKLYAEHEKAQAKYEKEQEKLESWQEKEGELSDAAEDADAALDEVFAEHLDKVRDAADAAKEKVAARIDAEADADPEPEEPEYPDEPDEPEYPDEPEAPEYPDEPEPPDDDAPPGSKGFRAKRWDEGLHPRDDRGRFVAGSALHAARHDPAKADALRARVTNPKERAKLEKVLGGQSKSNVELAHEHVEHLRTNGATPHGLRKLAASLEGMTVADLRELKVRAGAKAGGTKAELTAKLMERLPQITRETAKAKAKALIAQAAPHTPASLNELTDHLGRLTVADLKSLREEVGGRGGRTKREYADAVRIAVARQSYERRQAEAAGLSSELSSELSSDLSSAGLDNTAPTTPATTPATTEPWQMTRAEVVASGATPAAGQLLAATHRAAVRSASADGKPVPSVVLADYPGVEDEALAARAAKEAESGRLAATAATVAANEKRTADATRAKSEAAEAERAETLKRDSDRIREQSYKEPHEVTLREYTVGGRITNAMRKEHRGHVEAALAAGKPVPPEVLAGYPDMAAKTGKPQQNPEIPATAVDKPDTGSRIGGTGAGGAAPVPGPSASAAKEPHEVTLREYTAGRVPVGWLRQQHQRHVAEALAAGKPVPAEVLADYPALVARGRKS